MGTLYIGAQNLAVGMDDYLLHHIKLLLVAKLRRNEPFLLSWRNPPEHEGRHSAWIHRETDLHFEFHATDPSATDQGLLDQLNEDSNKPRGLELGHIGEHDPETGQIKLLYKQPPASE